MLKVFKNHFKVFNNRIYEIEKYINLIERQDEVIKEIRGLQNQTLTKTNEYVEMLINLKSATVNYNAIIISIYGCYENFIDDILREYLKAIIKLDSKYDSLNKKIREKYLKEATEYLSNPQRFENYDLKIQDVVENLYKCVKENNCNKINMDLILKHPANLKIKQINNLFSDLGIPNASQLIKESENYADYYMRENSIGSIGNAKVLLKKKCADELTFSILTDLVDRRNSVSHSWNNDDRISIEVIRNKYIKYIKVFCKSICEIICNNYVEKLYKIGYVKKFNHIINIYNNNILCLNGEKAGLQVGDYLLVKNSKCLKLAEVLNIRIDEKDINQMPQNKNVGLKLSIKVKPNWNFYYINHSNKL